MKCFSTRLMSSDCTKCESYYKSTNKQPTPSRAHGDRDLVESNIGSQKEKIMILGRVSVSLCACPVSLLLIFRFGRVLLPSRGGKIHTHPQGNKKHKKKLCFFFCAPRAHRGSNTEPRSTKNRLIGDIIHEFKC